MTPETKVQIIGGDSRVVLQRMAERGVRVHAVVTDPPYHLESIVRRFGKTGSAPAKGGSDGRFSRLSHNFIGQTWDGEDGGSRIAQDPSFWSLVRAVMLPGAYALAFSSASTGHRQACAMEDAGFIMHPMIGWAYGRGMPKAHAAANGTYYGKQTLKPALDPIWVAQNPTTGKTQAGSIEQHGVGGMDIEATRMEGGRWPSNLIIDGSGEVSEAIRNRGGNPEPFMPLIFNDKATKEDRTGTSHPTVKPTSLIRYLIRLVTPEGGTVLDPFAGSGTAGLAASREGRSSILIERELNYIVEIQHRLGLPQGHRNAIESDLLEEDLIRNESTFKVAEKSNNDLIG